MRNSTMTALALVLGLSALPAMAQADKPAASPASAAEAAGCIQAGAPTAPESFNKLDDNGDGFVSKQEYIEKCGKAGASAQSDDAALAHFASLDADRDQKLSADEFKSAKTASAASNSTAGASDSAAGASATGGAVPMPNQTRADAQGRTSGAAQSDNAATGSSLSDKGESRTTAAAPSKATTPGASGMSGSSTTTTAQSGASVVSGVEADRIIGMDVVNAEGKEVGEIKDLVLDQQQVAHAVVSVGGFLGIGAKDVAVPFEQLRIGQDNVTLMSESTKDELKQMPEYKKDSYTRIERKPERAPLPKQ